MCRDCLAEDEKNPRSLRAHAHKRDHVGVPIPCKIIVWRRPSDDESKRSRLASWGDDHKRLMAAACDRDLTPALEQHRFVAAWFQEDQNDCFTMVAKDIGSETSVEDEIASINERKRQAACRLRQCNESMRSRVADISDMIPPQDNTPPSDRPIILLRMWKEDSHTIYSSLRGFQCSDWKNITLAPSLDELVTHEDQTRQSLETHLDTKQPSRWISVSDSVKWIREHGPQWGSKYYGSNCQVAVISISKLDCLAILWERSDQLVHSLGMKGVKYAWPDHYLVYGWIPAQCIIRTLPFGDFLSMYEEQGIPGKRSELMRMYKLTDSAGGKVYDAQKLLELVLAKERSDEEHCRSEWHE